PGTACPPPLPLPPGSPWDGTGRDGSPHRGFGCSSRRETEQLLQDQPPGCFLVRFSESTVGFVLSYSPAEPQAAAGITAHCFL
uniref:SH2 domain-containing protein n=1 Tax=Apteryx owenii TaxID=8824 RepID=A0A8B9PTI2_APTOW